MATSSGYGRLLSVQEPDIRMEDLQARERSNSRIDADDDYDTRSLLRPLESHVTLRPLSVSGSSSYEPMDQHDMTDHLSVKSFNTYNSSASTGSSIGRLKNLGARIRRKPLPRYLIGSISRHPAADIEPTRIGRGVWKDQLLVDRSLRTMALAMSVFAIAMIILIVCYAKHFRNRANPNTSSIGGDTQSCKEVTRTNTALLLLINVCATMVLGMSNTYQQLVTSLKISDLKHVLSNFGDSRVGTNSPFSINHRQQGKKRAWSAWVLLIFTSMPIHFLANSLLGPSYIQNLPSVLEFKEERNMSSSSLHYSNYYSESASPYEELLEDYMSFPCWSAFRTGTPHYPRSTAVLNSDNGVFGSSQETFGTTWARMQIHYATANCSQYVKTATDIDALETSFVYTPSYIKQYVQGNCGMGRSVYCTLHDPIPAQCRLNVRMSAAFILAACLIIKAVYMCGVNLFARGKSKTHCLTFGDVIVASASRTELRVQGECMVNAGDNYRRLNSHTCHKHCKDPEQSKTGDEIGHCQKCKKWNSANRFSNLPQPTIATKIKKSLISNLGNTALTQMCLLMFCSLALVSASIAIAVPLGSEDQYMKQVCKESNSTAPDYPPYCKISALERFEHLSGGFGGFNRSKPLTTLAPDQLSNEFISFGMYVNQITTRFRWLPVWTQREPYDLYYKITQLTILSSNGAQFIYSLLYLMMIYNITLVSQEWDWGKLEHGRKRLRCTLVVGESFSQDYLLQLPKKLLFPIMAYSVLTHWMLGEALQTQEAIWLENSGNRYVEHSKYTITYAAYPLWIATFLILLMTTVCWWAFTYRREGFIPQMYGSIRALCAATTQLDDFPSNGIQWGDLGCGKQYRHAGLSAEDVMKIVPNELYAGVER